MFAFNNKVIYILSPDRWGTMHVSKHHYALELAKRGNKVYFIEPPSLDFEGINIRSEKSGGLYIVTYKPVMRGKRFLPAFLYGILIRLQIFRLKRSIGAAPDIIWCFEPDRFSNLAWFGSGLTIFHAVDFFTSGRIPDEAASADICFCSSEGIRDIVQKGGRPTFFINHGLNEHFCQLAGKWEPANGLTSNPEEELHAGYIGNLLMEAPDRKTMKKVIEQNPHIHFHFWGQIERGKGGLGSFDSPEVFGFIEYLKLKENVSLYGPVPINELYSRLIKMDVLWICWQLGVSTLWNEYTNPHKILEYLSTGKPVVSHYMYTYRNSKLIDMLPTNDNREYAELFSCVVERVKKGEPVAVQQERIRFALANTYTMQIVAIEKLIREHCQ